MRRKSDEEILKFYDNLVDIEKKEGWKSKKIRLNPEMDTVSQFSHSGTDTIYIYDLIKRERLNESITELSENSKLIKSWNNLLDDMKIDKSIRIDSEDGKTFELIDSKNNISVYLGDRPSIDSKNALDKIERFKSDNLKSNEFRKISESSNIKLMSNFDELYESIIFEELTIDFELTEMMDLIDEFEDAELTEDMLSLDIDDDDAIDNIDVDMDGEINDEDDVMDEEVARTAAALKKKKKEALKNKKALIKKIGKGEYNKRLKKAKRERNKPAAKKARAKAAKKRAKSAAGKRAAKIAAKRK